MITRLDGVGCAICMESLFCKRDDLDELCQIATPDCGHVFHEDCIRQWFKAQATTHLAHQRDLRGRSISPSSDVSDGPAECPTCRAECFADDMTGEPIIHRLFINLEGSGSGSGSSQMGSSPIRTPWKKGRVKEEEEVMGLARRAKALGDETKRLELGVDSTTGVQVGALLDKSKGLERDVVSQKAIDGIKKYIGGLTAATNNLRATITSHPLMADLRTNLVDVQARLTEATTKNAELQRQLKDLVAIHLPQEIASAIRTEQGRCKKEVKKVREEMEVLKRELDKEAVLRRTARREMDERLKVEEKKTAEAVSLAKREKVEREVISATLNERMKSLRLFQVKAESRKVSKAELEDLKTENANLRAQLQKSTTAPRHSPIRSTHHNDSDEYDESFQPSPFLKPRKSIVDDSLDIDYPSFAVSSSNSDPRPSRPHPTERTLASELFASDSPKPKKQPQPQRSKYFASGSGSKAATKANYLSEDSEEFDPMGEESEDDEGASPSPAKKSRGNPFHSTRADTERKKTLAPGKPAIIRPPPPKRTMETIDISSSPEARPPLRATKPNGSGFASGFASGSGSKVAVKGKGPVGKQQSLVNFLGIADKNGRPSKGLAIGPTVRRKA